jgi:methylmalonyl-CoA mutase cobalamin-binding subunit
MRPPREIACELVEDFWNKGGECTREYAQERIVAALKAERANALTACLLYAERHRNDMVAAAESATASGAQFTYIGGTMASAAIADFIRETIGKEK